MHGRVLIVDDDRSMCEMLEADLRRRGLDPIWHTSPEEAFASLKDEEWDTVLTDLNMPGMDGIDLCDRIVVNWPEIPVVVMTAFGSLETAIAAIRAGAYDFVTKPIELEMLALTLKRALKHRSLQERNRILSETVAQSDRFNDLVGESPPMKEIFVQLERIGGTDTTVLIGGESGTGKELAARALHRRSRRREGPFVAVNCSALPEALAESELFGHERGAFTGAQGARKGLFRQADGGTLFLDEIGDIPMTLQPKLLRALEERAIRPVGSAGEVPFDARFIAASNRDLDAAVHEDRFRQDLFYRINVIKIELPPLRARGTDVLLLARHFIEQVAARSGRDVTGLAEPVAARLLDYIWPGNVRELRNVIERAVALTSREKITVEDLPEKIRAYHRSHVLLRSNDPSELVTMEEVERRYILHVIESVGGNRTHAARILGLDRKTLYRKLKNYGDATPGG